MELVQEHCQAALKKFTARVEHLNTLNQILFAEDSQLLHSLKIYVESLEKYINTFKNAITCLGAKEQQPGVVLTKQHTAFPLSDDKSNIIQTVNHISREIETSTARLNEACGEAEQRYTKIQAEEKRLAELHVQEEEEKSNSSATAFSGDGGGGSSSHASTPSGSASSTGFFGSSTPSSKPSFALHVDLAPGTLSTLKTILSVCVNVDYWHSQVWGTGGEKVICDDPTHKDQEIKVSKLIHDLLKVIANDDLAKELILNKEIKESENVKVKAKALCDKIAAKFQEADDRQASRCFGFVRKDPVKKFIADVSIGLSNIEKSDKPFNLDELKANIKAFNEKKLKDNITKPGYSLRTVSWKDLQDKPTLTKQAG